jgi:hypothetical protein
MQTFAMSVSGGTYSAFGAHFYFSNPPLPQIRVPHISRFLRDVGNVATPAGESLGQPRFAC